MRRIVSVFLCVALLCLSSPGLAQADNTPKQAFISAYLNSMNQSLQIQKFYVQALPENTVKMNLTADLSDVNIILEDGTRISNMPGQASMAMAFNLQDKKGSLDFKGQLGLYTLQGQVFLDKDGMIITRDTIRSLADHGADFSELGDLSILPPYLVYPSAMNETMFEALQDSFREDSMNKQIDGAKILITYLLEMIPDNCYSYSDSGIVLDLKKIDFTSPQLLKSIKSYGIKIGDTVIASTEKPATMSDAEFQDLKTSMRTEINQGIENLTTEDIVDFTQQIPVSFKDCEIVLSRDGLESSLNVQCSVAPLNSDIRVFSQGKVQIVSDKVNSQGSGSFLINSPELRIDIDINSTGTADAKGVSFNARISGSASAPDTSVSGILDLKGIFDWSSQDSIAMPEITAQNSKVITSATSSVPILLDNRELYSLTPIMMEGTAMVPVRDLADALGCSVTWRAPDTVIISNSSGSAGDMVIHTGSTTYQIGGIEYEMTKAPFEMAGRVIVPLRPVAEYCGSTVVWDPVNSRIMLYR